MRLRNNMRIRVLMMSIVVMAVSAWVVGEQIEHVPIDADDIGGTVTSAKGPEGEGGSGVLPKAVKFQMRPDPLAK